jgi:hypothetical protein
MSRYNTDSVFRVHANMKELIRLYSKEHKKIEQLAIIFTCSRDEIERALKSQGQLL